MDCFKAITPPLKNFLLTTAYQIGQLGGTVETECQAWSQESLSSNPVLNTYYFCDLDQIT